MVTIKIGDREIPLAMSTYEMITIQEEVGCTVGEVWDKVFGMRKDVEKGETYFDIVSDKDRIRKFGILIKILGNAGLEEEGKAPDLTEKWILRKMKPAMITVYMITVGIVLNDAMKMEADKEQEGPVDVILAEENRKKEPGSSPTGESAPTDSLPD